MAGRGIVCLLYDSKSQIIARKSNITSEKAIHLRITVELSSFHTTGDARSAVAVGNVSLCNVRFDWCSCSPVHGALRGRTPQPQPRPPQARGDYGQYEHAFTPPHIRTSDTRDRTYSRAYAYKSFDRSTFLNFDAKF